MNNVLKKIAIKIRVPNVDDYVNRNTAEDYVKRNMPNKGMSSKGGKLSKILGSLAAVATLTGVGYVTHKRIKGQRDNDEGNHTSKVAGMNNVLTKIAAAVMDD